MLTWPATSGARGETSLKADGFCDAADGSVFRIRFMPAKPGNYTYSVAYRQEDLVKAHTGRFQAREAGRSGLLRVDRAHPWHFVWEGTGKHYFWNGTITCWLLGWESDADICGSSLASSA
ncbi:MAG: DUF5060 domain-containing protein [Armatimonadetes bacterium]|nr:DUF5060 domain-containing protein [Armatimonadota bacterium]